MKRRNVLCIFAALALAVPAMATAAEEGFVPLFDGKSLDGWHKAGGGATYRVEDGCVVGEVGPGHNTFLCTDKNYGNFVLKVDVKLDIPGNSGIQIRSHVNDKGRVFGYQCEIDPSERAWSGGIYDESRRGWLYPLAGKEEARKAFKLDGWNQYVIQAVGPSIKTWVNGVPCADLIDTADLSGFIALQVHSGKQGQIRWKNIMLKDLGVSQWKPLFNGKDFAGWEKIGPGQWTIEDGVIQGTKAKEEREHGHMITEKAYTDFAVRLQFKAIEGNSGLYFRVEEGGRAGVLGFQSEIDPKSDPGGLYETGGRAWVKRPDAELVKKHFKPGEWNEMAVVAWGDRIVTQVNGRTMVELRDDPGRDKGRIALQMHGGQDMDVRFKDIEVLDLSGLERPRE